MPESPEAAQLLTRAGNDWSIFDELARLDEIGRQHILRSHREAPFTSQEEIDRRERVDTALDRLMLIELGFETGVLSGSEPLASIPQLAALFESGAFIRYLDAYLYVSLRFVAGRLGVGGDRPRSDHGDAPSSQDDQVNELPVALPSPPEIPAGLAADGPAAVRRLLASLDVWDEPDVVEALKFLDDFIVFSSEQAEYELWLRGLSRNPRHEPRFRRITEGLLRFTRERTAFYMNLEGPARMAHWRERRFAKGAWTATNPLTTRFGLLDLYWLARLLRAEVSPAGVVRYGDGSWLALIAAREPDLADWPVETLAQAEEVLRSVFDFTCDLVQNAADIARREFARRRSPDAFPPLPSASWRRTYDEELEQIAAQRKHRRYDDTTQFGEDPGEPGRDRPPDAKPAEAAAPTVEWSRRIRTGEHVNDLVGLAFSGGGIRSATFNLGVLERLQELDLLRDVDYLSTVSGGGYIGAWLLGNVRRTRYWLSQPANWGPSIEHLRRFSNYLAPRTGLMSADTWTMWGTWIRNALLIQVSATAWLALLMVITSLLGMAFSAPFFAASGWYGALGGIVAWLMLFVYWNIREQSLSCRERYVLWLAVIPAWFGSFVTTAMLWAHRLSSEASFGDVIADAWLNWRVLLVGLFAGLWLLSWRSTEAPWWQRITFSAVPAAASAATVFLSVCAVRWLFGQWGSYPGRYAWYAYTAGPPLVLCAATLGIVVMIGIIGHASPDWRHEWWTRFGSWLGIYGVGFLAMSLITVFGPFLLLSALEGSWGAIEWSAVLGWLGTVVGGLLAGNSRQADGDEAKSLTSKALGWFARFAAFAFIVGAVLVLSTALHLVLVKVWTAQTGSAQSYWQNLRALGWREYLETAGALLFVGLLCSWRFEINVFGLNQFYRNRLIRCYLGATRWVPGLRKPHKFTGFDRHDDLPLWHLRHDPKADKVYGGVPYRGPFPIVNCSLNLGGSSDLSVHTRRSASFVLTPLRCGADRPSVGYAPAHERGRSFAGEVYLGQAISVSGAAASPNMGYNTSPLVAFLLTMFNVRLAWWFPNPGRLSWKWGWIRFSLWYLLREIFALADEGSLYVNVSDGGHFENLGVYELVRRRCRVIVACDAECDPDLAFGSLGRVMRMCQTDFGARIDIDVESIRKNKETRLSGAHCAVGRITYANGSRGYLIYLKSSLTGDEDVSVEQYRASHAEFPHETTGDQFFAEDQFESYRRLGHHVTTTAFRGVEREPNLVAMAIKLSTLWVPASAASDRFVEQAGDLVEVWERFRGSPSLHPLLRELTMDAPGAPRQPTDEELCACLELFQLMENVFLALRLDEFWEHPDNRGWTTLFGMWAKSPTFQAAWERSRDTFGRRFGYCCHERLGLADPEASRAEPERED